MTQKEKDQRLILKALCLTQSLVEVLDEIKEINVYTNNFKIKTKEYNKLLEKVLDRQIDGLFSKDEDLMLILLKYLSQNADNIVNTPIEKMAESVLKEKE